MDKPGWKTSEFWLTLAAQALAAVAASGMPSDSKVVQIAGLGLSALTMLGYQSSRAKVKTVARLSDVVPMKPIRGPK